MTKHEDQDVAERGKQLHDAHQRYLKDSHDDVVLTLWILGVMGTSALIGMTVAIIVTGA